MYLRELNQALTDQVQALAQRNAERAAAAREALGQRYTLHPSQSPSRVHRPIAMSLAAMQKDWT